MREDMESKNRSTIGLKQGVLLSAWRWFVKPLKASQNSGRERRAHLLAWILLFLLALMTATMIYMILDNSTPEARQVFYIRLILGLDVLALLSYGLNSAGYYFLAAVGAVTIAVIGPWGSLFLDPSVLNGDFVPLVYVTLSVILSSILLSPMSTTILTALQLAALAVLPRFTPISTSINWVSFLSYIIISSTLSILANLINQRDLDQIDSQKRLLTQREVLLRELSIHDHLTQLFNRRYLEETLEREIQRSARAHETIGVILFDVDHFKRVNDRYGHAAGDVVLQRLGRLARSRIRGGDIACRYGGEEFVLVLLNASLEKTHARAEELRVEIKQLALEYKNQPLDSITISCGVAMFPDHGAALDEILKSADDALYRAKTGGRDRVVVAGGDSLA